MHRAVKVRLYPNKQQKELIEKHFGAVRWVYNWALEQKIKAYQEDKTSLSKFDINKMLAKKKKEDGFEWLYEASAIAEQSAVAHMDAAFVRFFREKTGFPKFKSKKNTKCVYSLTNQKFTIDYDTRQIKLEKLCWVKARGLRKMLGDQISLTVSRDSTDKYFASIVFDDRLESPVKPVIEVSKTIGVDLGLKHFLTTSDGLKVENPRHLQKQNKRIKRLQRRLSKKKRDSKNREKARAKLAIEYQRLVNRRNDFLHKLSTRLIRENQAVCVETLSVQDMVQKGRRSLSRSICDASWATFAGMLEYKADWNGKWLIKIGRFEPSSKMCSCCGQINRELTLADRSWTCVSCASVHDRDINAAKNIKQMALQRQNLIGIVPLSQREVKPAESNINIARRSRNRTKV